MSGEALRIPVKDDYLIALGRAIYDAASLKNQLFDCGRLLRPGFDEEYASATNEAVGAAFRRLAEGLKEGVGYKAQITSLAIEFISLTPEIDSLTRSYPYTAAGGEQRLGGPQGELTIAKLQEFSDRFAQCDIKLNDLYYGDMTAGKGSHFATHHDIDPI